MSFLLTVSDCSSHERPREGGRRQATGEVDQAKQTQSRASERLREGDLHPNQTEGTPIVLFQIHITRSTALYK